VRFAVDLEGARREVIRNSSTNNRKRKVYKIIKRDLNNNKTSDKLMKRSHSNLFNKYNQKKFKNGSLSIVKTKFNEIIKNKSQLQKLRERIQNNHLDI